MHQKYYTLPIGPTVLPFSISKDSQPNYQETVSREVGRPNFNVAVSRKDSQQNYQKTVSREEGWPITMWQSAERTVSQTTKKRWAERTAGQITISQQRGQSAQEKDSREDGQQRGQSAERTVGGITMWQSAEGTVGQRGRLWMIFSTSNAPTGVTLLPYLPDSHSKLPQQGDPCWESSWSSYVQCIHNSIPHQFACKALAQFLLASS